MRSIQDAVNRIKIRAQMESVGYKPSYKCSKCKDTGVILVTSTGEEIASTEVPQSMQGSYRAKKCTCSIESTIKKCIARSGIDIKEFEAKTFETFKTVTSEQKKMKQLAEDFLDDKNAIGFGLFGKSGTGKTHISIACINEICKKGTSVLYFNYRRDIQELIANKYDTINYNKLYGNWVSVPVLYIDDMFKFVMGNNGPAMEEMRIMFSLLNDRYINRKKTMFSSEMNGAELIKLDEAIGSRIIEMCGKYCMRCTGENRRIKPC